MGSLLARARSSLHLVSPHSAVAVVCQAGQVLCGFVALRWTRPEEMGAWQLFLILDSYLGFLRLGVVNAMNRSYPYLTGRGEHEQARLCVATTQTYTFFIAALEVVALVAVVLVWSRMASIWLVGGLLYCVYTPLGLVRTSIEATFRCSRDFANLSRIQLWTLAVAILGTFWVMQLGFAGYMLRLFAIQIVGVALVWAFRPIRVPLAFDWSVFRRLVQAGVHLFANNWLAGVSNSFLRIAVVAAGGTVLLGQLTPILGIIGLGALLPATLSVYVLPRLNFEYGRTTSRRDVVVNTLKSTLVSVAMSVPLLAAGWFVLPWLVGLVAPHYHLTSSMIRLGLVVALASTVRMGVNAFSVLGAWGCLYLNTAVALAARWFGPRLGIRLMPHAPIDGALWGSLAGLVVQALAMAVLLATLYRLNASRPVAA
jgi:hypothetical protein